MNSNWYMISYGVAEIIFSQIPDFHELWWLSIVAAVMSFTYSFIGLGLGIGKVIGMTIHVSLLLLSIKYYSILGRNLT